MPHHPEMLAEHEGRARASTLHFSCPESRGMVCVKFLHLYVFASLQPATQWPRFSGATKSTYFLDLDSTDSDS